MSEVPGSLPSPLDSLADMRSTAKWIIGAAASVGAVVVGAAPIAAISALRSASDVVVYACGMVAALTGVGIAIWHTAEAMVPPLTTVTTIDSPSLRKLREIVERSPETFLGPFGSTPKQLNQASGHHAAVAIRLRTAMRKEQDPSQVLIWQWALEDSLANLSHAQRLQQRLIEVVHTWQVRESLRRARAWTMVAMVIVTFGVGLNLLATLNI